MARAAKTLEPSIALPAPVIIPVDFENDADDRLVTPEDVMRWLGISRNVFYALQHEKPPLGLPLPIKLGRASRWRLGTLRRWLLERDKAAARPGRR